MSDFRVVSIRHLHLRRGREVRPRLPRVMGKGTPGDWGRGTPGDWGRGTPGDWGLGTAREGTGGDRVIGETRASFQSPHHSLPKISCVVKLFGSRFQPAGVRQRDEFLHALLLVKANGAGTFTIHVERDRGVAQRAGALDQCVE